VTVKELHTFTDLELDTITDALRIANSHYRMMSETHGSKAWALSQQFRATFEWQAQEASALQLKIEANR